jgi:hypothetical protein
VIFLRFRESDVFVTGTAQSSYVRLSQYILQWIQMAGNTVLRTDRNLTGSGCLKHTVDTTNTTTSVTITVTIITTTGTSTAAGTVTLHAQLYSY